jgi:hypothetical protein
VAFADRFRPKLDKIRTRIPTKYGVRSVTLTVRTTRFVGDFLTGGTPVTADKAITSPAGDRYKVRVMSTKDVVASGGLYQSGAIKVGPITPPYPGGGWTKDDLIPPTTDGGEVLYGLTEASGQTQWCQMASNDTLHDLHWYLVLNPTGTTPPAPPA